MHENMTVLDWIVMCAFFVCMLGIGWVSTRLIKNTKDYFTGSGKMPWWLLGVSHHVSGYSAVAFTAYAAIAYSTGFTVYIWWAVPISFACFFGIFFIVSRWARLRTQYNIESPLEFISIRYDVSTQQTLAWLGVFLKILDVGAKWIAVALVITTFAPGVPFNWAIVISVALGLFYSTLGGLWAGTITDFAMFIIQFIAGIAIFVIVLNQLGGISTIWTIWDKLPPGHLAPLAGKYGTWTFIIGVTLVNILAYNGGTWNLAQRYIAAPRGSDAKKAALLSASLYLVWPLVLFFPMWAAPLLLPGLSSEEQLQQSYSMLVIKYLPPGLTGLMLAALVSHTLTMTTADATAITAVLVRDVIPKIWQKVKSFTEKQSLFLARFVTFCFMVMTALIAIYGNAFGGILGLILDWFSPQIGIVSVPMLLGLIPIFRRCGVCASYCCMIAGFGTFIFLKYIGAETDICMLAPTVVTLSVYIIIGLINKILNISIKKEALDMLEAIKVDHTEDNKNTPEIN